MHNFNIQNSTSLLQKEKPIRMWTFPFVCVLKWRVCINSINFKSIVRNALNYMKFVLWSDLEVTVERVVGKNLSHKASNNLKQKLFFMNEELGPLLLSKIECQRIFYK